MWIMSPGSSPLAAQSGDVLAFVLVVVAVWLPTLWLRRRILVRHRPDPPSLRTLHPYAVAMAFGGPCASVATAMIRLQRQGVLLLSDAGVHAPRLLVVTAVDPAGPTELDRLLIAQLRGGGPLPRDFAARATREQLGQLVAAGVFPDRALQRRCRAAALLPAAVATAGAAGRVLSPAGSTGHGLSLACLIAGLFVAGAVLVGIGEDPRTGQALRAYRSGLQRGPGVAWIRPDDDPDDAAALAAAFGHETVARLDADFAERVFAEAYRGTLP